MSSDQRSPTRSSACAIGQYWPYFFTSRDCTASSCRMEVLTCNLKVRAVAIAPSRNETEGELNGGFGQNEVVRTRAHLRGAVHGHSRHRDRERRSPVDPGGSRLLAGEPAVGDQRIRARVRRLPPARRASRGPPRAQAHLHGGSRGLLRRLALVRLCLERRVADRRAGDPGARSGADHASGALDPHDDVRRRARAQHRPRRVGRGRRIRRGRRRPAGRHPHRPALLGVDLLRQRPRRHRRARAGADPALREPRRPRPEPRRAGRGARHGRL